MHPDPTPEDLALVESGCRLVGWTSWEDLDWRAFVTGLDAPAMTSSGILRSEEAADLLFGALLRKAAEGWTDHGAFPNVYQDCADGEWVAEVLNRDEDHRAGFSDSPLLALLRALSAAGRLPEESDGR